VILSAA